MTRICLAYGRTGLEVELPDRNVVACLQYSPSEPLADPDDAVRKAIQQPIGTPSLLELARGRRNACVVISDVTRPVPNQVLLPPILETLEAAGIARGDILILVATGMHRPNVGEELVEMVGPEVANNYRIENHFGQRIEEHTYLGHSPRGVPAWIDSRYVRADLKITTGLIEPHFMAGFSGGRKLICPGLAALETVRVWHGPDFLEDPNARSGCLDGNPVHEESAAIARMAGCDFIVNVVIDSNPAVLHFAAGGMEAAHREGVAAARRAVTATLARPVDMVVTSGAGYPLDATFYQSIKGMVAALPIIKPGGTIIVAAACREGIGSPEFQSLFDAHPTIEHFMEWLLGRKGDSPHLPERPKGCCAQMGTVPFSPSNFVMDQWQLEKMAEVLRRARVRFVSDGLPAETLRRLFVDPAPSVECAVADALAEHGPDATIAVIPKGPYVLAELGSSGA
jgi:lactate racemase